LDNKRSVQPLAHRIFEHAFGFYHASLTLRSATNPDALNHAYPAIHLSYIAAELFLKCMVVDYTGKPGTGHDLKKLFLAIDPSARTFLSQRWAQWFDQHCANLPPELESLLPSDRGLASMLKTGEFMFLNSRYQWEGSSPQAVYVLIEVPMMLYEYIIGLHPNWKPNFRPQ
jgi:hypothetical protein